MARVMLVSLGTGPSVEHGIAYSIRTHRPDRVIFFVTAESEATLQKVKELLTEQPSIEQISISNGDNLDDIYQQACHKLRLLRGEEVFVDFTSGTKAMSAGLVAAAIAEEIRQLVYVSGTRSTDGRVISGTEQVITLRPAEILADQLKRQVIAFFNKKLFSAALKLVEQGLAEVHLPEHRRDLEELKVLCFTYQAWDWFNHLQAAEHFRNVNREMIARWSEQIAHNKGWVTQIASKLKPDVPIKERYLQELLIDLWLNAQRRMEEGHWIDAVARLYRLVELIAQSRLARQHGLDTGALDTANLPRPLRSKYEGLRDERGRGRLGLKQAYELLVELHDPLGRCYDEHLQGVLQKRNESIAGHGLHPVTEDDCRGLAERVRELLGKVIADWEEKAQRGRFPSL